MKIKITLKDPDGFWEAVNDAAKDAIRNVEGLSESERETLLQSRHDSILKDLEPWVECDEQVTIMFDTDAKTATVLPL